MEKYIRKCPRCNKNIEHKSKYVRNVSDKLKRLCKPCCQLGCNIGKDNPFYGKTHTEAAKEKIRINRDKSYMQTTAYKQKVSANTSGKKNPMYGRSFYDVWVAKYGVEKADELFEQKRQKNRIASSGSRNPMFGKPSPQGSGNGWSGWYKGIYFRSLKELAYMVNNDEQGIKWITAENIKIKYVNFDGAERTYCPDFLVEEKYLVEIKPTRLRSSKIVQLKQKVAEAYCIDKGFVYKIIDPIVLSDDRVRALHDSGDVKFIERYEQKFLERHCG